MAEFGITHHFKGATIEQYDNAVKAVHPEGGKGLPPGQTYHAAGPTDGGVMVVAIWESKASWEAFRDGTLLPGLATVENAPPSPPEEITFPIHNEVSV